MLLKRSAIDIIGLQAFARRVKNQTDQVISGVKVSRGNRGYGYNENFKTVVNEHVDIDVLKAESKDIERDLRAIRDAMAKHNAIDEVTYLDPETMEEVSTSLFGAFNRLGDLEKDLSAIAHAIGEQLSVSVPKDEVDEARASLKPVDGDLTGYYRLVGIIYDLKCAIARSNNREIEVEIKSSALLKMLRFE